MSNTIKLEVSGLSKIFETKNKRVHALENLNFSVMESEFFCFVGPSGCGKTTLLNLVAGLEDPDAGKIFVNGRQVTGAGRDRVMIFQEHALFPWLNVYHNVAFGLKLKGVPKDEREEIVMKHLRMVHLASFRSHLVHELSGGMKQRVAIARALALDPEVLLMDEPFAALDTQTREILVEEVRGIWQNTKKTILFVTHNVREAVYLGDKVVVFSYRPGKIKEIFQVNVKRPRDPEDPGLHEITQSILEVLRCEVEKAMEEEIG